VHDTENNSVIITINNSQFASVFTAVLHASGCRKHIGTLWHVTT